MGVLLLVSFPCQCAPTFFLNIIAVNVNIVHTDLTSAAISGSPHADVMLEQINGGSLIPRGLLNAKIYIEKRNIQGNPPFPPPPPTIILPFLLAFTMMSLDVGTRVQTISPKAIYGLNDAA